MSYFGLMCAATGCAVIGAPFVGLAYAAKGVTAPVRKIRYDAIVNHHKGEYNGSEALRNDFAEAEKAVKNLIFGGSNIDTKHGKGNDVKEYIEHRFRKLTRHVIRFADTHTTHHRSVWNRAAREMMEEFEKCGERIPKHAKEVGVNITGEQVINILAESKAFEKLMERATAFRDITIEFDLEDYLEECFG